MKPDCIHILASAIASVCLAISPSGAEAAETGEPYAGMLEQLRSEIVEFEVRSLEPVHLLDDPIQLLFEIHRRIEFMASKDHK